MKPAAKRKSTSRSSARRAPAKRAAPKRAPAKRASVKAALSKRPRAAAAAVKSSRIVATKSVTKPMPKPAERVRIRPPGPAIPVLASEITVHTHRFRVGEAVHLTAGIYVRGGITSVYKVTQLLPSDGDEQQYRIKSENEPHERVAKQSQLEPVA